MIIIIIITFINNNNISNTSFLISIIYNKKYNILYININNNGTHFITNNISNI